MINRNEMNCEAFEILGLDSERDTSLGEEVRQLAVRHARLCAKCAALQFSWESAQTELGALGDSLRAVNPPSRVQTRLLQQFRVKHQSESARHTVRLATWALAAAALMVCCASVWNWHKREQGRQPGGNPAAATTITPAIPPAGEGVAETSSAELLLASNDATEFTQLPGSSSQGTEDSAIVRVGLQRGSLAALGLPVNEEHAEDWIQVDLLMASDGSPQAVRLPQ